MATQDTTPFLQQRIKKRPISEQVFRKLLFVSGLLRKRSQER